MIQPSPYDSRDLRYATALRGLPDAASLRQYATAVDDQGYTNACTAHSTTSAMELLLARAGRYTPLSRLWAYWYGRTEDQRRVDAGANLRQVLKGLAKVGVVPESAYPFDQTKALTPPPVLSDPTYRITRYLSIGTNTDYDMQQIKAAIAAGKPVVIGMDLAPPPWVMPGMLHAMTIVGYDQSTFLIENSWGTGWGDGGFATLSLDAFKQYAFEAWVVDGIQDIDLPLLWSAPMSKTRVFLDSFECFTAAGENYAVYGGGLGSVLRLTPTCADIEFDQNIHTVELPFTDPVTMAFMQSGNVVHIYVGFRRVAYGAIKREGLTLVTNNGQVTNKIVWSGSSMCWNGTPIGTDGPTKTWS